MNLKCMHLLQNVMSHNIQQATSKTTQKQQVNPKPEGHLNLQGENYK